MATAHMQQVEAGESIGETLSTLVPIVAVVVLLAVVWLLAFIVHRRALRDTVRRPEQQYAVAGLDKNWEIEKLAYWSAGIRYHFSAKRKLDAAAEKIARVQ